jgi:hypothetical protein
MAGTAQKKTIDTLVEDIYSLFTNKKATISAEDLKELAADVTECVVSAISEERKPSRNLRLSMIGQPDRKIWYSLNAKYNNPSNKEEDKENDLSGSDYIKFLYGDILECLLVFLSKTAGHSVTERQKELVVNNVVGHQDGKVDDVLVDFKSASSFSFKKFQSGKIFQDDPFGYISQLSAYAQANDAKEAGFVVIDKTTGEITYCPVHHMEMINAESRIDNIRQAINDRNPPDRCYDDVPDGASGNRKLDTGCVYCSYKFDCWNDANNGQGLRAFQYSTNVKYLTEVGKTPNVPEL